MAKPAEYCTKSDPFASAALEVAKTKGLTVPPYEGEECLKCHVLR